MTSNGTDSLSDLLSHFQLEIFKEFVHRCMDEICERKGPDEEKFCSYVQWSSLDYSIVVKELKSFIINAVIHQYDKEKVESILSLDDEHLQGIITCLAVRKDEIQEILLNKISKTPGVCLQDFDWKLKLVMGSSALSSIQEPLLQLDLFTKEQQVQDLTQATALTKPISVELSHDNLASIINALEIADKSLII